jgi:hypothetical protein
MKSIGSKQETKKSTLKCFQRNDRKDSKGEIRRQQLFFFLQAEFLGSASLDALFSSFQMGLCLSAQRSVMEVKARSLLGKFPRSDDVEM